MGSSPLKFTGGASSLSTPRQQQKVPPPTSYALPYWPRHCIILITCGNLPPTFYALPYFLRASLLPTLFPTSYALPYSLRVSLLPTLFSTFYALPYSLRFSLLPMLFPAGHATASYASSLPLLLNKGYFWSSWLKTAQNACEPEQVPDCVADWRLIGRLTGRLIGWLIGRRIGWLITLVIDC